MNLKHAALLSCCALPLLAGCRQDMHDQPRLKPYGKSAFFADHRANRDHGSG